MIRSSNFNGGTNAATITIGNSGGTSGDAFSYVNGSVTYTTTQAGGNRGALVCSMPASGTANVGWDTWSLAARTFYWRMYVYLTVAPNANRDLAYSVSGGSSFPAVLGLNSSSQVRLANNGGTQQLVTTAAVSLNQWVRLEAQVVVGTTTGNGSGEIRLYNSADSGTPTESVSGGSKNFGTGLPTDTHFAGNTQFAYLLDSIGITDADWFGPDAVGVIPRPIIASPQAVNRAAFY